MPRVPPAEHGFGLFGPDFGVPLGGFCLSTFLLLEQDDALLVGRMDKAQAETWTRAWAPNLEYYDGERRKRLFDGYRFPATYVREGEHPTQAAARVWRDQLDFGEPPSLGEPEIVSETGPSRRAPGAKHWDVLFVYTLEGPDLPSSPPSHWAELAYETPDALRSEGMAMLHDELLSLR